MIDVGFWEVAMIGVLALIILGPERLPGVARTAGAWMGKARRMMNEIKNDLKSELDESDLSELKDIRNDIQQAGESFKSQLESGQDTLQKEGSTMDTAIADALNKPASAKPGQNEAASDEASPEIATRTKSKAKAATTRKKTTRKPASRKKISKKKVTRKTSKKKAGKKVAGKPVTTPDTEKSS